MAIIRRTNSWLPSIFNDFFGNEWMEQSSRSVPAVTSSKTTTDLLLRWLLGMTKEDCVVRLDENNNLVIEFEKKTEQEDKDKRSLPTARVLLLSVQENHGFTR